MNIDTSLLMADLHALEQRIAALKTLLRQPWTRAMADEQQQLLSLAAEATALYTLRAWSRGRLHRTCPPRELQDSARDLGRPLAWDAREHNRRVAERLAPRYHRAAIEPVLEPVLEPALEPASEPPAVVLTG